MECGEHHLRLLSNLGGLEEFGFGLESDNVKTEAVEGKANTIMDQTKRPEVEGNPAYLLFFNCYLFFFFSFTCRGVSENDQDICSFCFKSKQLYNQYLNDCVNDADLAENLASTFQTWYFFKLSCSLG